jgi:hypothetical protein
LFLVDEISEKRKALSATGLLYRESHGDLRGCRDAMKSGTFSGEELIRLGEIDKAVTRCRSQLGTPIGERALLLGSINPFRPSGAHLSDRRLAIYTDPTDRRMGPAMRKTIGDHLRICNTCRAALDSRADRERGAEPASMA